MMTREYLESLGMTDQELDRRYGEAFGAGPLLFGEDTAQLQALRHHRFRELGVFEMGGFKHVVGRAPMGAFAADDPETHAEMANKQ